MTFNSEIGSHKTSARFINRDLGFATVLMRYTHDLQW